MTGQHEKEHFSRMIEETGSTWWGRHTPAGRLRNRDKIRLFNRLLRPRPGEELLEAGCGSGEFTELLADFSLKVTACDLAYSGVLKASRQVAGKKDYRFTAADLGRLPFRDDSFDLCLGVSILHHVPLDLVWPEIIRVCRPGSRFFFSEPNMLNPWIMIEKNVSWIKRKLGNSPGETAFFRRRLKKQLAAFPSTRVEVQNIDFIHPLIPESCLPAAAQISGLLERVPLVKEISGSLAIWGSFTQN